MKTIKLTEWCAEKSINYLTAYRWFKAGKFPEHAYQTDSGTILVEDTDNAKQIEDNSNAMAAFLKKTVEFSKNNSTVEDFAAYVISTFQLKIIEAITSESPLYSKNKPKTEDVQKHFAQFIPAQDNIDYLKQIKSLIKDNPNHIQNCSDQLIEECLNDSKMLELFENGTTDVEGAASRNVEFVSTPQQTNYTGSTDAAAFDNTLLSTNTPCNTSADCRLGSTALFSNHIAAAKLYSLETTQPIQKRRGRKPSKNSGKK